MRIRTHLNIITSISITMIVILTSILYWSQQQFMTSAKANVIADRIIFNLFECSVLKSDYLQNNRLRAKDQWISKNNKISDLIMQAEPYFKSGEGHNIIFRIMKANSDNLNIFQQIVANREGVSRGRYSLSQAKEIENMLAEQLLLKSYFIMADTSKMQDLFDEMIASSQKTTMWAYLILIASFSFFMLVVVWYFNRFINNSIKYLEQGAVAVGAGDFSHTIPLKGENELTDVAGAFNTMTREIAKSYAALKQEITEHKQAVTARHDSERNYRTLVDNALVGVFRSTIAGKFLYVNEAMSRIFDCSSPQEMLSEDVLLRYKNPKDRDEYIDALKLHGKVSNYEFEGLAKSGKRVNVIINAALDNEIISGMVLDISEHKKLEGQFRQAQKMEAIGLLAGGVAHDFNNILTAIIGYSHLSLMKLPSNDPVRLNIEQIIESSNRAAVLTQSLLAFSRRQPVNLAVVDLNLVIKEFEKFIHRLIREDIALETVCTEGVLSVMADRGQIEQVIMNLVTNARDAMPHGGKLLIATGVAHIDREFIEAHGFGEAGEYALVSVSDTGIGMDEQTRSRIFEPFFTTKEQGKGTGLGLSMVYGTVKQHNGYINVYSEPGEGTTLKIYLPRVRSDMRVDPIKVQDSIVRGGTETILVAEDDATIRKLTVTVLIEAGYTVIEAVNGADAVLRFQENKDNIRLVLLDGIMPKMNGKEAFKAIRDIVPDIPCIFMSGYSEDIFNKEGVAEKGAGFIFKPASPADLLIKIRETLGK